MIASVSACAGVSGGVRGRASSRRAASSASRVAGEHPAAGELAQHQPAPVELELLAQALERGHDLVQLDAERLGERVRGGRARS